MKLLESGVPGDGHHVGPRSHHFADNLITELDDGLDQLAVLLLDEAFFGAGGVEALKFIAGCGGHAVGYPVEVEEVAHDIVSDLGPSVEGVERIRTQVVVQSERPVVHDVVSGNFKVLDEFARVLKVGGELILLSRVSADAGLRQKIEKGLMPVVSKLGFRTEFAWSRYQAWVADDEVHGMELVERRPIPPLGHFSLIRFRKMRAV